MFSTNLIQSNYGDLNIKSLAFDSFKERLQSTMTALTFFISTGQCDCDEIAESNFNYMIAYMSNINYDASKPGAPALSFDTYLQDNVKYRVCLLYTSPSPRDRISRISYAVFCLKKKKNTDKPTQIKPNNQNKK